MAARPDCSKYVPIHRLIGAEYNDWHTRKYRILRRELPAAMACISA